MLMVCVVVVVVVVAGCWLLVADCVLYIYPSAIPHSSSPEAGGKVRDKGRSLRHPPYKGI